MTGTFRPEQLRRPIGQRRLCVTASVVPAILWVITGLSVSASEFHPLKAADTSSPRATLRSFLTGMKAIYDLPRGERAFEEPGSRLAVLVRQVGRCLDGSQLPEAVQDSLMREAAVCLKETLDRIELPPESEWPDEQDMADRETTRWTIPNTEIVISRMESGPRRGEYLFSSETVDRASEFYEIIRSADYIDREWVTPNFYSWFISHPGWMIPERWIPEWSRTRWFGQAIWQWFGLTVVLLTGLLVMGLIYLLGRRFLRRDTRSGVIRYLVSIAFPVSAALIPLLVRYLVTDQLHIYGQLALAVTFGVHVVLLAALTVLVMSIGSRLAEVLISVPWIHPAGLDAQLIRLTFRCISIALAAVIILEGGQRLGIPLTTLLAGASVSGLAVALAAQDSLKNILGSMMIMFDKPFRIGERVVVSGYDGTVEDIGLRSTRLRLLSGHQVSIPNEILARSQIENIGRRPYIRRTATIPLPSSTPAHQVQRALDILRNILADHEGMNKDLPPRVYLRDVNDGSVGIYMTYWYHPPDYWKFLAFSERVTLEMCEQFAAEGIPFSLPVVSLLPPPSNDSIGDGSVRPASA